MGHFDVSVGTTLSDVSFQNQKINEYLCVLPTFSILSASRPTAQARGGE